MRLRHCEIAKMEGIQEVRHFQMAMIRCFLWEALIEPFMALDREVVVGNDCPISSWKKMEGRCWKNLYHVI